MWKLPTLMNPRNPIPVSGTLLSTGGCNINNKHYVEILVHNTERENISRGKSNNMPLTISMKLVPCPSNPYRFSSLLVSTPYLR